MEKTLGEKIVRTQFNPEKNDVVQNIKERAAEFINYVNNEVLTPDVNDAQLSEEMLRNKHKAIDAIELAAMYAVKAATVSPFNK